MINSFFLLIFLSYSLLGYAFLFKKFFQHSQVKSICNCDFAYGFIFIIFISLFFHFFFPLKYINLLIIIFGICLYFIFLKKYKVELNLTTLFFIQFFFLFISVNHNPNYDTMLYHHQILNWNYNFKIVHNLSIVDQRLGMVSPWHLFLSLYNFKLLGNNISHIANILPISFFFNEIFSIKKNFHVAKFFLVLSIFFILFFSLIHPFGNGIILMHLGSLETDMIAMIFCIISIYCFIKILYNSNDVINQFHLLLFFCLLTVFSRINYFPIFILPAYIFFKKNYFYEFRIYIFIFIILTLWIINSLIVNGCVIYPVYFTCLEFDGYLTQNEVKTFLYVIKSFARTLPDHFGFMNIEYSINSFEWIKNWFSNYFLQTSLSQIFVMIFLVLILPCFYFICLNYKKLFNDFIVLFFVLIILIFFWLSAPDIRFALGIFVSFISIVITVCLSKQFFSLTLKKINIIFYLLITSLLIKNYSNISFIFEKKFMNFTKYDKSKLIELGHVKQFKVVHNDFCFDVDPICISKNSIDFKVFTNKYNYIFFKKL